MHSCVFTFRESPEAKEGRHELPPRFPISILGVKVDGTNKYIAVFMRQLSEMGLLGERMDVAATSLITITIVKVKLV